jgi:hypothetical protein
VGSIGCESLSTRALGTARDEHPVLRDLTIDPTDRPYFDGVAQALRTHEAAVVAAGLEAFLAALLELLARFIGADVVVAMTEQALNSGNDAPEPR